MKTSGFTVRGITLSAMFAALLVVLSFVNIHLGFSPVPITLENFAIMLTGALLGARYGLFSIGTVVVLTAIGLPLLHGSGGLALVLGPTGGYIWAYPFAALFIGMIAPRIRGGRTKQIVLTFLTLEVFGSLMLYVTGVPWLAHTYHMTFQKAMVAGCYPYLIGDAVKAFAGALIVVSVRQWISVSGRRAVAGHSAAARNTTLS
ncbi:biotin transporter BioY [Paenibacillus aurantius]|uniref:Biotin transporter n=1 Tax=Paenibacillus aurantius TaxID=2918900 RepID=A0AA96RFU3_9BACL|nr:biotin transporter BioY [Paenibacillus aurantius]WNQ12372.1 biotin transporter BioY [Paenibacillus aurantius]